MSVKQMTEILYTYDMRVISVTKDSTGKLMHRKRREDAADSGRSIIDQYFRVFY